MRAVRFVTQAEAGRRLGVHPNTVANMLADGRLKAVVIGAPPTQGGPSGRSRATRRVEEASLIDREDRMFGKVRRCESCRLFVTAEEARLRVFNTGLCACGGRLLPT